jgi:hypothetical protein
MFRTQPAPGAPSFPARPLLGLCLVLPLIACAAKPQLAAAPPPPVAAPSYTGTIAAIRPESSGQDTTGSIQQIMTILGQPAAPAADASEVVLRLSDNTVRTNVQAPSAALAPGNRAMVTAPPNATIQPY